MKQLIIFDFDGTLVDTAKGIINSIKYISDKHNLTSTTSLEKWVGPPIEDSFIKYCGISNEDAIKLAQEFRVYYKDNELYNCRLFNNIVNLLWQLKIQHKIIAIASNKRIYMIKSILNHFYIDSFFDYIAGMTEMDYSKSKADLIKECLIHFNISPANAIMVGDTEIDAQGAAEANVDFIGVTWGIDYSKSKKSHYKTTFIENPLDILQIIN